MPYIIRVDGQGRIVLPKEVRRVLGIEGGSKLVCRLFGSRIIIEKFSIDEIQEAFRALEELVPNLDLDVVEVEGEDKYVDREYALRKIGLGRDN